MTKFIVLTDDADMLTGRVFGPFDTLAAARAWRDKPHDCERECFCEVKEIESPD